MNKMLEETGKEIFSNFGQNLEVYFHGGVNFEPYREQYKKYSKKEFKYYEYTMPLKVFAIQDLNNSVIY
jgi:hypothetical protein